MVKYHKNKKKRYSLRIITVLIILIAIILLSISIILGNVSKSSAGEKAAAFINNYFLQNGIGGEVKLQSVEKFSGLYKIDLMYNGEIISVYVTKDKKYIMPYQALSQLTLSINTSTDSINLNNKQIEILKSDNPKVELFVMSHCPFGAQSEKGIIPVVELLSDKIDFELKFVYYAIHGEKEVLEQLNQYCVQNEQNDKFLTYLKCFLKDGNSNSCLIEAKIDKTKLKKCTSLADKKFNVTQNFKDESSYLSGVYPPFDMYREDNRRYNVGGSPTLVINGVQSDAGRDSASYLNEICRAFNNIPIECSEKLSSVAYSAGFGYDSSGSSVNAGSCS